jgi:hypothetical protein
MLDTEFSDSGIEAVRRLEIDSIDIRLELWADLRSVQDAHDNWEDAEQWIEEKRATLNTPLHNGGGMIENKQSNRRAVAVWS